MSCMLFGKNVSTRIINTIRFYSSNVTNDLKRSTFCIELDTNTEAYLKYSIDANRNVIILKHTFVPDAGKGKGIGKLLAQAAFQYAIDNKLKLYLECDFTSNYYKDNESKYKQYVMK